MKIPVILNGQEDSLEAENNENLLTAFQASLDYSLIHVNACRTKKEAQAIADTWNESAKAKGEYAFE